MNTCFYCDHFKVFTLIEGRQPGSFWKMRLGMQWQLIGDTENDCRDLEFTISELGFQVIYLQPDKGNRFWSLIE